MPTIPLPGKRILGSTNASNANNGVIGGYDDTADHWQTTTKAAQEGEQYQKAKPGTKKRLTSFQPEDLISPITGNRIADYGTWAEDIKNKERNQNVEEYEESDEEVTEEDALLNKLKLQLNKRGGTGILGMARIFRLMDDDNSKSLSFKEFRNAMKQYQLTLSEVEVLVLFKRFGMC